MARKTTKKAPPEPKLYVVRKGLVTYIDHDGTRVEIGPGGKVPLTDEEVSDLDEGIELETPEERDRRLGDAKIETGQVRPYRSFESMVESGASGGISEETATRLAEAIETNNEVSKKLLAAMDGSKE